MIFQTLDDKKECVGVYVEKQLKYKQIPKGLTKTWSYSPYLKGLEIDYAQLYVEGKSIQEIVPENLKKEWESISNHMKAFINSFIEAKVSLNENCFFELVPQNTLKKYCEVKNKITEWVFENYKKLMRIS